MRATAIEVGSERSEGRRGDDDPLPLPLPPLLPATGGDTALKRRRRGDGLVIRHIGDASALGATTREKEEEDGISSGRVGPSSKKLAMKRQDKQPATSSSTAIVSGMGKIKAVCV